MTGIEAPRAHGSSRFANAAVTRGLGEREREIQDDAGVTANVSDVQEACVAALDGPTGFFSKASFSRLSPGLSGGPSRGSYFCLPQENAARAREASSFCQVLLPAISRFPFLLPYAPPPPLRPRRHVGTRNHGSGLSANGRRALCSGFIACPDAARTPGPRDSEAAPNVAPLLLLLPHGRGAAWSLIQGVDRQPSQKGFFDAEVHAAARPLPYERTRHS